MKTKAADPTQSYTESYLLDASCMLNGELWLCSLSMLMDCKPEMYVAWKMANKDLESTPKHEELDKSIKAVKWVSE